MDQVKFFKDCLAQCLLGPFLNTLSPFISSKSGYKNTFEIIMWNLLSLYSKGNSRTSVGLFKCLYCYRKINYILFSFFFKLYFCFLYIYIYKSSKKTLELEGATSVIIYRFILDSILSSQIIWLVCMWLEQLS